MYLGFSYKKKFELVYIYGVGYFMLDENKKCLPKTVFNQIVKDLDKSYKKHSYKEVDHLIYDFEQSLIKIEKEKEREMSKRIKEEMKEYSKVKGGVYFLKSSKGIFKIGKSKNVKARIDTLKAGFPFSVELFKVINTEYITSLEKKAHKHFEKYKVYGQCFDIKEEQISDFIIGLTHC